MLLGGDNDGKAHSHKGEREPRLHLPKTPYAVSVTTGWSKGKLGVRTSPKQRLQVEISSCFPSVICCAKVRRARLVSVSRNVSIARLPIGCSRTKSWQQVRTAPSQSTIRSRAAWASQR